MELEYEAYLVPSQLRQLPFTHSGDILTIYEGSTSTGLVQCSNNVEKSRFTRPRGSHYHHELSLHEFQRYATECVYGNLSQPVALL